MDKYIAYNIIIMIKYAFLNPTKLFEKIDNEKCSLEVFIIFLLSAMQTFIKSFNVETTNQIQFFSSDILNSFFVFLSIPQIRWLYSYVLFFIFIYLVSMCCRIIFNKQQSKIAYLYFLSISAVGAVMHPLFILLRYIFTSHVINILAFFIFLWSMVLYFKVIMYIFEISFIRVLLLIIILSITFLILGGFSGLAPYLSWL